MVRLGYVWIDGHTNSTRTGYHRSGSGNPKYWQIPAYRSDTTVTGLIVAGVAWHLVRKRWYEDDLSVMEALIESVGGVYMNGD